MRRPHAMLAIFAVVAAGPACGSLLTISGEDEEKGVAAADGAAREDVDSAADSGDGTSSPGDAADADADATPSKSDAYRAAILTDLPIAYWRFAEGSGATSYASETMNHPALPGIGTKAPTALAPGIFGASSYALLFNGTNGMHASAASLPFLGNGNFTFEAWLMIGSPLDGNFRHLSQHSNGSVSYGIYLLGSEGLVIERIASGTKTALQTLTSPSAGVWHHVVATRDAALHLYVDGVAITTGATYGGGAVGAGAFTFGAKDEGATSLPTNSRVAEVAVYDKALDAARITHHYDLGKQ